MEPGDVSAGAAGRPAQTPHILHVCTVTDCSLGLFKIVTEMFMPHISILELEQDIFLQLLPKAIKHFHNLVFEISSQASQLSSQNTELKNTLRNILQDMAQWIEALTACVRYVCSIEEVDFKNIQSLPSSVLQVLITTFTHCKDSDSVYCGRLHLVSDLLQSLFKEAVSLEKQLMELLDKTTLNVSASAKEITGMVSVIHTFLDICSLVSKMDHALHANTWKFIIKQTLKHHTLVKEQMRHDDIVSSLCDDIVLSFQTSIHLAEHMKLTGTQETTDQRLFQKTLKLCRFFANSLVHYTKEFMPFLEGSCVSLHQLYLQIHSLFPPSLFAVSMSDAHKHEIRSVFLVVLEALIPQLLSSRLFMDLVLSEQELPPEHHFTHCLLLITIMNKLPSLPDEQQILWCSSSKCTERMSIFKAVLQRFARCSAEVAFPVVLQDDLKKDQNRFTFYQYETAELCAHHVKIITLLVKSSPNNAYQLAHLTILLRRLFFLMDADNQVEFVKLFPPTQADNLSLWQHVSLSSLPSALRSQVETALFTSALSQSNNLLKGKHTQDIKQLNVSLSAMLAACRCSEKSLDGQQQSCVMEIILQLWSLLSMNQISGQPSLLEIICLFLDLFALVIKQAEPSMLKQVVSFISSFCQEDSPSHVKLTVLDFLSSLGKIVIPQEIQVAVLPNISALFSMLLADKTWIIKQHALETFALFAEETSHEEIVPQSLNSEETKTHVVCFLNQNILHPEEDNRRLQRLKDEKQILETFFCKTTKEKKEEPNILEPSAKRPRQATVTDEEFDKHIKTTEKSLTLIHSLLQESPLPHWLPEKLRSIQGLLAKIQKTAEKM
ncbi:FIGNL1-interacting regulator of recombination and mitosis isoform 3-T4 [Leptodactylus fuscus]|uniref:FIGNL1-interacting regulator of recombination and mitosis isoform X3 n=1 Tax=Leptodactylus fuscus TaxID=238119 RepID=UPI003F4EAB1B